MKKLIVALSNFATAPKVVLKEIFDNSVRALWDVEYVEPMSHTAWGIPLFRTTVVKQG
jgi:hypothetical protein